jgi:predicted ArsR family transcriptional regulator
MEKIGEALGVSQRSISTYLANLEASSNLKRSKTTTNPKGAGRPKRKPGEAQKQRSVNATPEDWEAFKTRATSATALSKALTCADIQSDHKTRCCVSCGGRYALPLLHRRRN